MSVIKELIKPLLEEAYNKGLLAGIDKQKAIAQEDQNRRLEDMLKYGKEIGHQNGYVEGYIKGYEIGYAEGEQDTKDREGIIEVDGEELASLIDDMEAI